MIFDVLRRCRNPGAVRRMTGASINSIRRRDVSRSTSPSRSASIASTAFVVDMGNAISSRRSSRMEASDPRTEEPRPRPLSPAKAKELDEFREQLTKKREARRKIIAEKAAEMESLRRRLREETNENKMLRALMAQNNIIAPPPETSRSDAELAEAEEVEEAEDAEDGRDAIVALRDQIRASKCELAECNAANQTLTEQMALSDRENFQLKRHVQSLKDVNRVSKEMIAIRESQLSQLKEKLTEIEKSLADRETKTLSNDLKLEYERQLENIRNLRVLYEERARAAEATRIGLLRDLEEQRILADSKMKKCEELESRIEELEKEVSDKSDALGSTEDELGLSKAEMRDLQAEMTVINKLFSQMLLGYKSNQNLDNLVLKLEENHDLLTDMVGREDCSEVASALPKLILDLVNQAETDSRTDVIDPDPAASETNGLTSAREIVGNLPKVWRVLMELLSHQVGPQFVRSDISEKSSNSCYNCIETPSGPQLVPSVSKTYIRLKDLILEKKSLQKEMSRLKNLNGHLESRLQDQERRLGLVSSELSKTWHVVGKMQRQHQQLHTHERILQFELQEKRLMLTELKQQLEFCKEKWDQAKQKNSESQEEWNKLRMEFASRKIKSTESANNSGESGYSDERASDEDSIGCDEDKKLERRRIRRKGKTLESNPITEKIVERGLLVSSNSAEEENIGVNESLEILSDEDGCISSTVKSDDLMIENIPCSEASASRCSPTSYDEKLANREARLKKLEEQCYVLVHKITKTNNKGVEHCNRLEELHNQYGGSDTEQGSCSRLNDETSDKNESESQLPESSNLSNARVDNDEHCKIISEERESPTPAKNETIPSTSSCKFDYEARFAARDERLRKLEEQAKCLVDQVTNTSSRGEEISTKLTELHNTYGKSEEAENDTPSENKNDETIKDDDDHLSNDTKEASSDNANKTECE